MIIAIGLIFISGFLLLITGIVIPDAEYKKSSSEKAIEELGNLLEGILEKNRVQEEIREQKNTEDTEEEAEEETDDIGKIAAALKKKLTQNPDRNYSNIKLEDIKRLYSAGLSIQEIAQKLEMGQREVELIMKLGRIIQ